MAITKCLLIGCGKMGGALLNQWQRSDRFEFTVLDPVLEALPGGGRLVRDSAAIQSECFDIVIIAVKPQIIDTVMPAYQASLAADGVLVSIAAGYSIERLKRLMGDPRIVRVMPNLPSSIGQGVSGAVASDDVSDAHKALVGQLMDLAGTVVWVDTEDSLDRLTAISGSGPGFVFEIARSYLAAAIDIGFEDSQARQLVLETILGATAMAIQSDESLETLRNSVTSKNGATQAGLEVLRGAAILENLLQDTIQATYNRTKELR